VVVMIENGPWTSEAVDLVRRRAGFVEGSFDEGNRVRIEWEELRQALRDAPDLADPSFEERYLS
jgi:hypothetical protein